jgi:hypothetical protein
MVSFAFTDKTVNHSITRGSSPVLSSMFGELGRSASHGHRPVGGPHSPDEGGRRPGLSLGS